MLEEQVKVHKKVEKVIYKYMEVVLRKREMEMVEIYQHQKEEEKGKEGLVGCKCMEKEKEIVVGYSYMEEEAMEKDKEQVA